MLEVKSEQEINIIRGKMLVGAATTEELRDILTYILALESLVGEASSEDYWGSEGYEHRLGWD